jgi:hypothetical protein
MDVHDRLYHIEQRLSELEKIIELKQEDEYRKYLAASQSKKTLAAIVALERGLPKELPKELPKVLPKVILKEPTEPPKEPKMKIPLWSMRLRK